MGQIITFYSYKGGVGRSMALANTAATLARWGYKTLMVDWDLEAPGLENFFQDYADLGGPGVKERPGVVDLLSSVTPGGGGGLSWEELRVEFRLREGKQPLHLLTAGRRDAGYFRKVRNFDVEEFYLEKEGGEFVESLRREWKEQYEVVLLDSRTGVTDLGGICTIQLPDVLVLLFTATDQGLGGTIDVARKATAARQSLPFDRLKLLTVPVASRFDVDKEHVLSKEWLGRSAERLGGLYADWLPTNITRLDMLELTKIPYKAYFSFGEKLAVLEENAIAPDSLAYSYTTLGALLANRLERLDLLRDSRDEYVRLASKSEPAAPDAALTITPEMLEEHRKWNFGLGGQGKRLVLTGAKLRAQDLSSALLMNAVLVDSDLSASNLSAARLYLADLSNSDLQGANLESARLGKASLHRAILTDANLRHGTLQAANLQGANLQGADLSGADFRQANLSEARLTDARAEGAMFHDANLRNAVLTGVVGLSGRQFAGADLSGAEVRAEFLEPAEVKSVEKSLPFNALLFLLLMVCLIAFVHLFETTDRQVIVPQYLPPVLRILSFDGVSPFITLSALLCALHLALHFASQPLWRRLGRLPAIFPDGKRLDDNLPPWLAGIIRAHFARLGEERRRSEIAGTWLLLFSLWWLVPLTLLPLWLRYLVRHDLAGTLFQLALLTVATTAAPVFRRMTTEALRGESAALTPAERAGGARATLAEIWWALKRRSWLPLATALGGLLLAALSYGAIRATPDWAYTSEDQVPAWYNPYRLARNVITLGTLRLHAPYARLINDDFKGADLYDRDLRYARATAAYFDGATLTWADLTGIDLQFADLRGAHLAYADLSGANLKRANLADAADLRGAKLVRAALSEAWLPGANLGGADLQDADLSGANLQAALLLRANLNGANLRGADLSGADLSNAFVTGEQLTSAVTDAQTRLPDYLKQTPPQAGDNDTRRLVSTLITSLLQGDERRDASKLIAASYEKYPRDVVGALLDALLPEADDKSYRVNLYIATTLAGIRPYWQGTLEEKEKVEALTRSRHYTDPTFSARVTEALKNYRPLAN